MRKTRIALLLLLVLAMLGNAACVQKYPDPLTADDVPSLNEPGPESDPIFNPLTGLEVAEEISARVIVVSIDNLSAARPQAGLSQADIVYEVPAEGGISRYQALFYGQSVEKIGPVRSTRPYIVDIARGWGALYVHCGWSEDARKYLQSNVVDYLNELTYSKYFYRDKSRKAPHNLYTSTDSIYQFLNEKDKAVAQEVKWLSFYTEDDIIGGEAAETITFKYPYANNIYQYNAADGFYYRYLGDNAQIDPNNDKQIKCANIIMQKVNSAVLDSAGRLSINMTAGGEAMLFTGGKMQTGTWQRSGLDSNTVYLDASGNQFKLSPGSTWIQICDGNVKLTYTAPEPEVVPESNTADTTGGQE